MQEISYTGDGILGAKRDSSVACELTAAGREERGNHPVLNSAKHCLTVAAPAAV